MSGNIIAFPDREKATSDRLGILLTENGIDEEARALGTPVEWQRTAISYLKAHTGEGTKGAVTLSLAALHIVLGYVEELEDRLDRRIR